MKRQLDPRTKETRVFRFQPISSGSQQQTSQQKHNTETRSGATFSSKFPFDKGFSLYLFYSFPNMVSRKKMANGGAVATAASPPVLPIHKIPTALRFPLAVFMSMSLSALLYSLTADLRADDLAIVSRRLVEWWQVLGLLGFKAAELAIGWWGGYDGMHPISALLDNFIRQSCQSWLLTCSR